MKNLYDISKGQLITLWVFGFIGWFFSVAPALDYTEKSAVVLFLVIPCALIFYTLGWRKHHKNIQ